MISQERLKELLNYDPESGLFTWRRQQGKYSAGSVAGNVRYDGYIVISIGSSPYLAHRLAWLYTYGKWPTRDTDHIDRDRANNRIANLRDVTRGENLRNTGLWKCNISGTTGVAFHVQCHKWRARYGHHHLGLFNTKEEAIAAREAYIQKPKLTFNTTESIIT